MQVAAPRGVQIQPDPLPLLNVFIRSDQYNFVRHGIPSLMIDVGAAPGSPGANDAARPRWKQDSFFRRYAKGAGA